VDTPIPLQNISSAILGKVIEYCTQHKDDEPAPPEEYVVHSPAHLTSLAHTTSIKHPSRFGGWGADGGGVWVAQ
jgi:hypothetical protein